MRTISTIVVAVIAATCGVPPAEAATVELRVGSVEVPKGPPARVATTTWTAAPGEVNRLTVTFADDGGIVLRDASASLAAGAGCAAHPGGAVTCTPPPVTAHSFVAEAGDGDDAIVLAGSASGGATVRAGEGDDRVEAGDCTLHAEGGPGADLLLGGARWDSLAGGPGPDELRGGGGVDTLLGDDAAGPYAADRLDGGPGGRDHVDYSGRAGGVVVDLAAGTGGAVGEGDLLAGVEHVTGGDGEDVLLGDERDNVLDARYGAAGLVDGRGGDDVLRGGGPEDGRGEAAQLARLRDGGPHGGRVAASGGEAAQRARLRDGPHGGRVAASGGVRDGELELRGGPHGGRVAASGGVRDGALELRGGDGDDELSGSGRYLLDGGDGGDRLWGKVGAGTHRCGGGRDRSEPGPNATVAADCERIVTWLFELSAVRAGERVVGATLRSVWYPDAANCGAELRVRAGGRPLGRTTARIPERRRRRVRIAVGTPLPGSFRLVVGVMRCERGRLTPDRSRDRESFRFAARARYVAVGG
jgi:hypothetical protein